MLNSLQIEAELLRRGFSLDVDSAHAKGYGSTLLMHPVFVKQRRVGAQRMALGKAPLVIHPELGELASAAAATSSGLQIELDSYANSNLRGFPRSPKSGEQEIEQGIALSVADEDALEHLIRCLTSEEEVSPTLAQKIALEELNDEPGFNDLPGTTRSALVQARVGQGSYRQSLMAIWLERCSVTGVKIPEVLIASHVKSWKRSSNAERLDRFNGLLLTASIDKLFDKGLISFDDQGCLLTKEDLPSEHLHLLGLSPQSRLRAVPDRLRPYLADHRSFHGFVQA